MRVLITGAAGYLGSQLCYYLHSSDFEVFGLDNLSTGIQENWQHCVPVEADLRHASHIEQILQDIKPDIVVHLASLSEVRTHSSQASYHENNVRGSQNLLRATARSGTTRLVVVSSACVYGAGADTGLAESAPKHGLSAYAQNKLALETMLLASHFNYICLRPFVISGFCDGYTGRKSPTYDRHLLPQMCGVGSGRLGPRLNINGMQWPTRDGTCIRDFVHAQDVCAALARAMDHLMAGRPNLTLNLGSGIGHSIREVMACYTAISGKALPYDIAPADPADAPSLVADVSQAKSTLGWHPTYSLDDVIRSEMTAEARLLVA